MDINEYYLIKQDYNDLVSSCLLCLDKSHEEVIYCYDSLRHDENGKKYHERITFTLNDIDNMVKQDIIEPFNGAVYTCSI